MPDNFAQTIRLANFRAGSKIYGSNQGEKIVAPYTVYGGGGNDYIKGKNAFGDEGKDILISPVMNGGAGNDLLMADVSTHRIE